MQNNDCESHSFLSRDRYECESKNPDAKFYLRKRYFVGIWIGVGYMLLYIFRSNLSIALVELTAEKVVTIQNKTIVQRAELDWDSRMKGFVLSLFAYGFFLCPVGGVLAAKYGGVSIFSLGTFLTAILTLLTPFLLRLNLIFFAIARVLEGIIESFSAAAFLNIFTRWAPPHELSRLVTFGFAGIYAGTALNYSLCGFLAQHYGVDSIFFVTGGAGIFWYIISFLFIPNDPSTDRFMTATERNYFKNFIRDLQVQSLKPSEYPWKAIFTSIPAWALFNEYFTYSWLCSFVVFCFPLYIKDTFKVNVESVGYISTLPVLSNFVGVITASFISDYLRSNGILPVTIVHRMSAAIGQLSCATILVIISLWANLWESIVLFTLMRFLSGMAEVTYHVACIDMFNDYAGLVKGFATLFFNLGVLLNPTVMGFMVTDHSRSSWNLYFLCLSGFNIFGFVIFFIFGSGELQHWAAPKAAINYKRNENTTIIKMKEIRSSD